MNQEQQQRWISYTATLYNVDLEISPCVSLVSEDARTTKPKAYTPQFVGLGPYHHIRLDVQEMKMKKCAAVKKYLNLSKEQLEERKLADLVDQNAPLFEYVVRSCYNNYLDFDRTALSWIATVDSIFLLNFVKAYNEEASPDLKHLVPDILMLENQIPFVLLQEVQEAVKNSFQDATCIDQFDMFSQFCLKHSPFDLTANEELKSEAFDVHLLHYMYQWIMRSGDAVPFSVLIYEMEHLMESLKSVLSPWYEFRKKMIDKARKAMSRVKEVGRGIAETFSWGMEQASASGIQVPSQVSNINKIIGEIKKVSALQGSNIATSASQLSKTGLEFACSLGGIKSVGMVEKQRLQLPHITLRTNSEVIFRNLVAYEGASAKPGSTLVLADYVDLMCLLIETEADVKLLREKHIIEGDLSDKDIVSIFNGIYISARKSSGKSEIKEVMQEVMKQAEYGTAGIKKFFGCMQKIIKQLFPVCVLILLSLQYYCDIRGCSSRSLGNAAMLRDSSSGDGSILSLDPQAKITMPRKILVD